MSVVPCRQGCEDKAHHILDALYCPTGVMLSLEGCEPNLVDTQMFRWAHRHIGGHTQFGEMEPISSK